MAKFKYYFKGLYITAWPKKLDDLIRSMILQLETPITPDGVPLSKIQIEYNSTVQQLKWEIKDCFQKGIPVCPKQLPNPTESNWICPLLEIAAKVCSSKLISSIPEVQEQVITKGIINNYIKYHNSRIQGLGGAVQLRTLMLAQQNPTFSMGPGAFDTILSIMGEGCRALQYAPTTFNFILAIMNRIFPFENPGECIFFNISPRFIANIYSKVHQILYEKSANLIPCTKMRKGDTHSYVYSRDDRVHSVNFFEYHTAHSTDVLSDDDDLDKRKWYLFIKQVKKDKRREANPSVADHFEPVDRERLIFFLT